MRLAFMGTPLFAVKALSEVLAAGHEVVCVYSQPPRPKGRGHVLTPSPVHEWAEAMGLEVRTPTSMKSPEAIADFQALDIEASIVVAYGQILKSEILDHPPLGCFNLHGSLLPRWRGAAPIQRAIMAGDAETGVEVMRMSLGLDEGPVLLRATTSIEASDTAQTLHDRLADMGANILTIALGALERGTASLQEQSGEVTYAHKISPSEAKIDWQRPAKELDCHIRGLSPFPGAWTEAQGAKGPYRLKVLFSSLSPAPSETLAASEPGTIMTEDLDIMTSEGQIRLVSVQREGKTKVSGPEFLKGSGLKVGDRLL